MWEYIQKQIQEIIEELLQRISCLNYQGGTGIQQYNTKSRDISISNKEGKPSKVKCRQNKYPKMQQQHKYESDEYSLDQLKNRNRSNINQSQKQ